jgi:hypothetical protein
MAKQTLRTFRGVIEDQPLTAAERRRLVDAPFPTLRCFTGKSWGGLSKRESIIPDSGGHTWSGHYAEGDAND